MNRDNGSRERPGRVEAIEGVVFQCDLGERPVAPVIRWLETASWRMRRGSASLTAPLANHVGVQVRVALPDSGRARYVTEVLSYLPFTRGAAAPVWTPLAQFSARDRGGWHVTLGPELFVGVGRAEVSAARAALNALRPGQPAGLTCALFVEHVFGGIEMFLECEALRWLRPVGRLPEPASPRLRPGVVLPPRARWLLNLDSRGAPRLAG